MQKRFGGFTDIAEPDGKPLIEQGKDREDFADFYKYATERGTLFYAPGAEIAKKRPVQACTGPVTYQGHAEARERDRGDDRGRRTADVFLTATAPASLEVYRRNRYYKTDEEYVFAIAEAMRVEYEAIAAAGLILQVDDAWLPALWDRIGCHGADAFRARSKIASRRSIMRCAIFRKTACAITCAGAVGMARMPTISLDRIVDLVPRGESPSLSD